MTYGPNSPIRGPATMTAQQLYAAFEGMTPLGQRQHARMLLDTMVVLCQRLGIDPIVMAAIVWIETGEADTGLPFRSKGWLEGFNAGNLGITGDEAQNAAAQTWPNPEAAAYGLMAHMVAYVYGEHWPDVWPAEWGDPRQHDIRFTLVLSLAAYRAATLRDLNGTWAVDRDNNYHGKLAERANSLIERAGVVTPPTTPPQEPTMPTFGNVPHPAYDRRLVENSTAWNDLGPRVIRAAVWHRMYGTLWGTDGYFRGAARGVALTDYGVGVAATDGSANAGKILMWNDPRGRRAPWANGSVNNPIGDGLLFWQRYGTSAVNRDAVSIEISGSGNTPLDEAARAAIVALTAYWADQYEVSWETFPLIPSEGDRSFVIWHGEFHAPKRGVCPGNAVESETNALIQRVKEMLRVYQTGGAQPEPPQYATPSPVPRGSRVINDFPFLAPGGKNVQTPTAPRLWADVASAPTGPVLPKDFPIPQEKISHYVVGTDNDLWVVLTDIGIDGLDLTGSRFPARALIAS